MTNEELLVDTVDPARLDYPNPIFERIQEDPNNPWFLEEQIKYYKNAGVPIAHFAFKGQKKKHYYAIFNGESKADADAINKMNNCDIKRAERAENAFRKHETDSYDVMLENGYDAPADDDDPAEIVAYQIVMDALSKEYNALSEEKRNLCNTIKKDMSQRDAAAELGVSRRTYRDHKDAVMGELAKKLKSYR